MNKLIKNIYDHYIYFQVNFYIKLVVLVFDSVYFLWFAYLGGYGDGDGDGDCDCDGDSDISTEEF